jgi:6-phosphofructokinase 1
LKVESLKTRIMEYKPHTIGVLTSGGDAPGMNAALRAVTRAAISNDIKVKAIYRGYKGLIDGEVKEFTTQDVSGIIPRGGTIIKSARCPEFTTKEGREQAYATIQREGIEALIVIGGDGSFTGGRLFAQEYKIPVIGIPGTIDNDLWGTDATIGYDTALNTIMHCVDMLRDTATSHERVFLVEVMGRDAGFLTLNAAIAAGAEAAIIPERATIIEQIEEAIGQGKRKSKNSSIVLVQEHAIEGGAQAVAKMMEEAHPEFSSRVTILGHLQRGGSPTASDRILASRMGIAAVQALLEDQRNIMVGLQEDEIVYVPLSKAIKQKKDVSDDKWAAMQVLSI